MSTNPISRFSKLVIILPFYFFFLFGEAQTLIPDLYYSSGSTSFDNNSRCTIDNEGNLYTIGRYSENAYFNNTLVTTYGISNFILSKFDIQGNFLWGKTIAYGSSGAPRDIIWFNGSIYICGNYSDHFIFRNNNSTIEDTISSKGNNDFFIARYDSQGSIKSYKSYGNEFNESVRSIGILNNNIVLSGVFNNYIEFDTENPNENNTIFSNQYDVFIACIDTNYNFFWAKRAGGNFNDALNSMKIFNGDIYITGSFISNMNFNSPSSVNSNLLSAYGSGDIFVAKYDTYGNPIWFKRGGSSYDYYNEYNSIEYGTDLFVNKHGVYVVGIAERDAHFNGPQDTNFIIFEDYDFDEGFRGYFLAHYDLNGSIQYVKDQHIQYSASNITIIDGSDLYYSISGKLNLEIKEYSSYYQDTFRFNPTLAYEIITRLYDYQGNFITGAKCGGIKQDYINDIQLYKNNIYITGTFNETLNFYDGETAVSHLVSKGANDIFIARYPFPDFIVDSTVVIPNYCLNLFPNPAEKQITITNTSDQIGLKYLIFDMMGRIISQGELSKNENIINISELNAGVYFVKIMTTKPKTIKFIKY
ncbi:MAG: hypothetical protein CVU04_02565 [Bacteroidetes bacterium HGW-Bacteroidetes-20]|nr:MAG: hypothetical protein CVU04_02565 [Bacteroidetes bacterium HGW-Bacteroidetes-20]